MGRGGEGSSRGSSHKVPLRVVVSAQHRELIAKCTAGQQQACAACAACAACTRRVSTGESVSLLLSWTPPAPWGTLSRPCFRWLLYCGAVR